MTSIRFADRASITVEAGRGGNGCRSSYKDLWSRHPIPDGGDGGRGGHVLLRANPQLSTLLDFQTRRHFRGGPGGHGSSKRKHGAQGTDCRIDLPLGTVVRDAETGELIRELLRPGEEVMVAEGGAGGVGNARLKKRSTAESLQGRPGRTVRLDLELKLVADVGIIGMPNAGKSTLISRISQARPKVAPFPFTTVHPVLGAVTVPEGQAFVAVDVPGLIEGSHRGRGLGLEFLRHIERTRLLVHLIDMAGTDGRDPIGDYRALRAELEAYGEHLEAKPAIVVANKMDRPEAKGHLDRFRKECRLRPMELSAETGEGIPELLEMIKGRLKRLKQDD